MNYNNAIVVGLGFQGKHFITGELASSSLCPSQNLPGMFIFDWLGFLSTGHRKSFLVDCSPITMSQVHSADIICLEVMNASCGFCFFINVVVPVTKTFGTAMMTNWQRTLTAKSCCQPLHLLDIKINIIRKLYFHMALCVYLGVRGRGQHFRFQNTPQEVITWVEVGAQF